MGWQQMEQSRSSMVKMGPAAPTFILWLTPPSSFSLSSRFPIASFLPSAESSGGGEDSRRIAEAEVSGCSCWKRSRLSLSWDLVPPLFGFLSGVVVGAERRKGEIGQTLGREMSQLEDAYTLLRVTRT